MVERYITRCNTSILQTEHIATHHWQITLSAYLFKLSSSVSQCCTEQVPISNGTLAVTIVKKKVTDFPQTDSSKFSDSISTTEGRLHITSSFTSLPNICGGQHKAKWTPQDNHTKTSVR